MSTIKRTYFKDTSKIDEFAEVLSELIDNDTVIICVGTDKCIGDCLGPLVGTLLKEKELPLTVYGTIEKPIHALNVEKEHLKIRQKHPDSKILAIDACIGSDDSIGDICITNTPVNPGCGVGKKINSVGDFSIVGIVDSCKDVSLFTTRPIRLDFILKMAKFITDSLISALNKEEVLC